MLQPWFQSPDSRFQDPYSSNHIIRNPDPRIHIPESIILHPGFQNFNNSESRFLEPYSIIQIPEAKFQNPFPEPRTQIPESMIQIPKYRFQIQNPAYRIQNLDSPIQISKVRIHIPESRFQIQGSIFHNPDFKSCLRSLRCGS